MSGFPVGTWIGRYLKNGEFHSISLEVHQGGAYSLSDGERSVNSGTTTPIGKDSILIRDNSENALKIQHKNGTCRVRLENVGAVVLRLDGKLSPDLKEARSRYPFGDLCHRYCRILSHANHYHCEIFHFTGALLIAASQWEDWPFRTFDEANVAEAIHLIRPMGPNQCYSGSRSEGNEVVDLVDTVWESAIERDLNAIPLDDFLIAAVEYPSAENQQFLREIGLDATALLNHLKWRCEKK